MFVKGPIDEVNLVLMIALAELDILVDAVADVAELDSVFDVPLTSSVLLNSVGNVVLGVILDGIPVLGDVYVLEKSVLTLPIAMEVLIAVVTVLTVFDL